MVTAKTQYNLKNADQYFEEHLCVGDYYNEGQRVSGDWFGVGAERLGLSGKVRADDFLRLFAFWGGSFLPKPRPPETSPLDSPFPLRWLSRFAPFPLERKGECLIMSVRSATLMPRDKKTEPSSDEITASFARLRANWRGQTVALSERPMTSALVYDRVVLPRGALSKVDLRRGLNHWQYGMRIGPDDNSLLHGWRLGNDAKNLLEVVETDFTESENLRQRAALVRKLTGAKVVPIFGTTAEQNLAFQKGNRSVVVGMLTNIAIVDEQRTSFSQVLEFRRDADATKKYRRLLRWLDKDMVGKSEAEVSDTVAQKLEDYGWALRKHGLKTVLGVISETFDAKYFLGTSGVAAGLAATGNPVLGAIAGGGLAFGRLMVKAIGGYLDWKDAERGLNSEIAWVHEVKTRL